MKNMLILLGVLFLILCTIVFTKTALFKSKQVSTTQYVPIQVGDSSVANLQKAIQFQTVSYDDITKMDSSAFFDFQAFLKSAYPLVFSKLELETVNSFTLILHWKGKLGAEKPIIFMAHQDVVPVEEESIDLWKEGPFSGAINDGWIYGRGSIDDKGSLIALFETAERLLSEGFQPQSDIYFLFGHDEEIKGERGAKAAAQLFTERKIIPEFVFDEGGMFTFNKVPGVTRQSALVGISEKGYQTIKLKLEIPGGHSSMPKSQTAIDGLAKAVVALKEQQFDAVFCEPVEMLLDYIGPEMPFTSKMAMANRWLFSPLIKRSYNKTPAGSATLRTTTASTIFDAGIKENVIPSEASAIMNFRTLPGVTQEDVINHIKKVINDTQIQILPQGSGIVSNQIARLKTKNFEHLQKTLSRAGKDMIVAPFLVLGATDSRYFAPLTDQIFRFTPFTDLEGFHGINERLNVEDFKKGIGFYYEFMKGL